MRFEPTTEQLDFARTLDKLLVASDTVAVARAWAADDSRPGLELWAHLADQGVTALLAPEEAGGLGAGGVELVLAFEALGRHVVPGPWVESAAYLPVALAGDADGVLTALVEGQVGTVAVPPHVPLALDADVADHVLVVADDVRVGTVGARHRSVDGTRRLFEVVAGERLLAADRTEAAYDTAVLASAAQLLGCGERLLADTVAYVKQRRQFGREIGSYQAVKHRLADVRIALDFARPSVLGGALSLGSGEASRDVSAARVAAGDAAYLAARSALQLHGAIGYTGEFDLSLWILRVRALLGAWGTQAQHRARVLAALQAGA